MNGVNLEVAYAAAVRLAGIRGMLRVVMLAPRVVVSYPVPLGQDRVALPGSIPALFWTPQSPAALTAWDELPF